ncbi:UDP-N-acetylmuramate dehydrogenase [Parvularcula sp. IMCC14364]|uniref:UDP-N-acetylmuramate dehydrogenase n=1 Tax=Parvularcula sp. IMCC14364 TaxID=3067902 RepID=UPI00274045F4|nr:UDP-N-acetylmuramate dehydrogenase [Parvularcula sp. IMCC14364]
MRIQDQLPEIRGKYIYDAHLADITWFRVGGPAEVIVMPADVDDLTVFLAKLPADIPIYPLGVGSNLLVRDGGLPGVVLRLGAPFAKVETDGLEVQAGAAALDATVAKRAAAAGIAGLEFYRGIPGSIGGALRMNAGAYGAETKDILIEATALDRRGKKHVFNNHDMGFTYRRSAVPDELIFIEATYRGHEGAPEEINQRMKEIMQKREDSQPIRERTGGSTFKNPDPDVSGSKSSWQLIDSVGARGRIIGDAQVSPQHCNFLINRGQATAADLENLGESVRADVLRETGVDLQWEIKRIGQAVSA